jgi:hypothetical protein
MRLDRIHIIERETDEHYDWPILARSKPWEDNRQISALFAGVCIVGAVIIAWFVVWLHPR